MVISSNISISTSKAHLLPTQFLHNEFDVNEADEFANHVSNQSPDEISKAISKKRKFGELWGLGRKVMVNAIEDSNEDIYHELLGFFTSIQNRTSLQRVNNEVSNVGEVNKVGSNGCMLGSYSKNCKKKGKSNLNADDSECYEELSTTSTSHESVQDTSDTEESGSSNPMVLISSPMQPIDFQNREHSQRQCSICHRKGHNS
ncbi:protein far1-related sequence 5-like [Gigaspora margarita]|uniref:Protein far1-related sequence 5-like n=1 Tax=Gigaspora margarita TaxID=4874 RepID=A0A8H3XCL6_GIGMA|nr:protein far1-related sequence 5-like [Gigaspora margarita]